MFCSFSFFFKYLIGKAAPIYKVHVNTDIINKNIGKFKEYCPVCYIDDEELIKGDPGTQFVAEYDVCFISIIFKII